MKAAIIVRKVTHLTSKNQLSQMTTKSKKAAVLYHFRGTIGTFQRMLVKPKRKARIHHSRTSSARKQKSSGNLSNWSVWIAPS